MKKILCAALAAVVFFSSCKKNNQTDENPVKKEDLTLKAKEEAVSKYISSLSVENKISQLFLVNIEGNEKYHSVEKTGSLYGERGVGVPLVPGGVLLFSYNISKDPLQMNAFIRSIHDFYRGQNAPLPYVAVDQEGGDVNRLRSLTSVFWSQKKITESFSPENSQKLYDAQAEQMRLLGFNMNLAPVVEVLNQKNAEFLDTRSFGDVKNVLDYGFSEITSFEKNKVATVLKHFPGNSSTDPHTGLPVIFVTKESLEDEYLKPFYELSKYSSAILMSHALVSVLDDDSYSEEKIPATLSKYWVTSVVREKLAFTGLIFSDDIFMAALADNGFPPEKAVVQAVEAGVDVIMLSEKKFGSVAGILLKKSCEDEVFAKKIDIAVRRVIDYKIKAGLLVFEEMQNDEDEDAAHSPCFRIAYPKIDGEIDLSRFNAAYERGMKAYE